MGTTPKRRCTGTNKAGKPCGATPLRDQDWCNTHAPELPESARFAGGAKPGAGRPRVPGPTEVARQLIEENVGAILSPFFNALGYDVIDTGDGLKLEPVPAGGAKLYGTDKGEVIVSSHDDLEAMQRAAERLLDRGFGKPRQSLEHTGANGGPITFADLVTRAADSAER